jgi:protein-S-isoprenylcysteine O-methyltransferase Ste14
MVSRGTYDVVMRLPLLGFVVFAAGTQVAGLQHMVLAPIDAACVIHVAMRLSTIAFLLLIAAVVILRNRPIEKARGLEPRISALVGTFLIYGFPLFPRRELSLPLETISTILIMIGSVGAVLSLFQLGRSFSVMAETRQLVTSGPYRFVRHPLYLTEGIAVIGLFVQCASVWTALLFAVQIAFQLRRMHNEETLLRASFPEYAAYSRNTRRLIPRIY